MPTLGMGIRDARETHLALVGMSARQLEVMLAVMSHERCYGCPVPRKDVARFLGVKDVEVMSLVRGRFLEVDGKVNQVLSATPRAWRELGFSREERLAG